ncbi:helix-turn-helix domain-containing protein [Bacillus thuringiensis]
MANACSNGSTVLRKIRESKGLTVKQLSRITKVPENTLYCIEII